MASGHAVVLSSSREVRCDFWQHTFRSLLSFISYVHAVTQTCTSKRIAYWVIIWLCKALAIQLSTSKFNRQHLWKWVTSSSRSKLAVNLRYVCINICTSCTLGIPYSQLLSLFPCYGSLKVTCFIKKIVSKLYKTSKSAVTFDRGACSTHCLQHW